MNEVLAGFWASIFPHFALTFPRTNFTSREYFLRSIRRREQEKTFFLQKKKWKTIQSLMDKNNVKENRSFFFVWNWKWWARVWILDTFFQHQFVVYTETFSFYYTFTKQFNYLLHSFIQEEKSTKKLFWYIGFQKSKGIKWINNSTDCFELSFLTIFVSWLN